jgi:hypothetical protein
LPDAPAAFSRVDLALLLNALIARHVPGRPGAGRWFRNSSSSFAPALRRASISGGSGRSGSGSGSKIGASPASSVCTNRDSAAQFEPRVGDVITQFGHFAEKVLTSLTFVRAHPYT